MDQAIGRRPAGSRCIALVGPYLSGKTSLLEAILFRTGAIQRQGKISDKSTVGDAAPEWGEDGHRLDRNLSEPATRAQPRAPSRGTRSRPRARGDRST